MHGFVKNYVAEARTAVIYEKPWSSIKCHYVWKATDLWIDFPWSAADPLRVSGNAPGQSALYAYARDMKFSPGLRRVS